MPTADELVLKIVLDASGFEEGRKKYENELKKAHEDTEKIIKAIEEQGKKIGEFFKNLKEQALSLFAVFTGGWGLKELIEKTVLGTAEFGRAAENIGITTNALYAWEVAVQEVGGSTESLHNSLMNLSQDFAMASISGQSKFEPVLRSMGVQVRFLKDGSVDLNKMLLDLAKWGEGKPRQEAIAMYRLLGLDPAMIDVLLKGVSALQQKLKTEGSIAPTQEQIERTQRLQAAWSNFITTMQNLASSAFLALFGDRFDVTMKEWEKWFRENKKQIISDIAWAFSRIGDALGTIYDWIVKIDHGWKSFYNTLLETPFIGTIMKWLGATPYANPNIATGDTPLIGPDEDSANWRNRRFPNIPGYPGMPGGGGANWKGEAPDWALPDTIPDAAKPWMSDLARRESGGMWRRLQSEHGVYLFPEGQKEHPGALNQVPLPFGTGSSTASGAFQILYSTWQEIQKLNPGKFTDFSDPKQQADAAWWYAQYRYSQLTKRPFGALLEDLNAGGRTIQIDRTLQNVWKKLKEAADEGEANQRQNEKEHGISAAPRRGQYTPFPGTGGSETKANPYDIEHMTPYNRERYERLLKERNSQSQGALLPSPGSAGRAFASNTTNSSQVVISHLTIVSHATNAQELAQNLPTYLKRLNVFGPLKTGLA